MTEDTAPSDPPQEQIQALIQLYGKGRLAEAEKQARLLIGAHPGTLILHNLLGACLAGQARHGEAANSYRRALAINPDHAPAQNNLAKTLETLGDGEGAEASYRKAIAANPGLAQAHLGLGALTHRRGELDQAISHYREALKLEPGHAAALNNLGSALEAAGRLDEAESAYREAVGANPDLPDAYNNLGGVLRAQGKLEAAGECCRQAIALKPDFAAAYNNLGSTLKAQGRLDEARTHYRKALEIKPDYAEARYNLGLTLQADNQLAEAAKAFEASGLRDSAERAALCLYKTRQFEAFRYRLDRIGEGDNASPLAASLSAHYARNFNETDPYRFCPDPMDFIHQSHIGALSESASQLRGALLQDIERAEIDGRTQKLLHNGIQSSGHLFQRNEASFGELATLIRAKINAYKARFAGSDCVYMARFPDDIAFTGAWYVKMSEGGHLDAHIHEGGWLSGVVYLSMPETHAGDEGNIGFSLHGGGYPKRNDAFSEQIWPVSEGDIVLFPSSLFHRTLPFKANEDRICVSFDLKPPA